MGQFTRKYVGENLSIAVRMRGKPILWSNSVFVEYAERSKILEARVIVLGKRESMIRVQPAMVGMAALRGAAWYNLCVRKCF